MNKTFFDEWKPVKGGSCRPSEKDMMNVPERPKDLSDIKRDILSLQLEVASLKTKVNWLEGCYVRGEA